MGTAIRTKIAPKRFKIKFIHTIDRVHWNDAELVDWIKNTAEGSVWYTVDKYETSRGSFRCYSVDLYFSKKQDAMFYKLSFMV